MTTPPPKTDDETKRELAQLLRLHARLLTQLNRVREELNLPSTKALLADLRDRIGSGASSESVSDVTAAIEEALKAVRLSESTIRAEFSEDHATITVEGVDNLPPKLAFFLTERSEFPGFSYEVHQDENRGWVIRWKEHTMTGTVRGFGQFYERPYAWLHSEDTAAGS